MQWYHELIDAIRDIRVFVFRIPDVQSIDTTITTWTSVIVSILALVFSIVVPYRIARNQNKIALLEKRIEAYQKLEKCFCNRSFLSVAISNRIFHTEKEKTSLNPFKSYDKTILFTTCALFPCAKKDLERLADLYDKIVEYDFKLSDGIDYLLLSNEDRLKRIIQLFEEEITYEPSDYTKKELKEISDSYYRIPKDQYEWENVPCNLYDLSCEQAVLINKAYKIEKEILLLLEKDIRVK